MPKKIFKLSCVFVACALYFQAFDSLAERGSPELAEEFFLGSLDRSDLTYTIFVHSKKEKIKSFIKGRPGTNLKFKSDYTELNLLGGIVPAGAKPFSTHGNLETYMESKLPSGANYAKVLEFISNNKVVLREEWNSNFCLTWELSLKEKSDFKSAMAPTLLQKVIVEGNATEDCGIKTSSWNNPGRKFLTEAVVEPQTGTLLKFDIKWSEEGSSHRHAFGPDNYIEIKLDRISSSQFNGDFAGLVAQSKLVFEAEEKRRAEARRQAEEARRLAAEAKRRREEDARRLAEERERNRDHLGDTYKTLALSDRKAIQRRLLERGFYKATIDGVYGAGTRKSLDRWAESLNSVDYTTKEGSQKFLASILKLEDQTAAKIVKAQGRLSTDLKNSIYAKSLLADLRDFVRQNPTSIDPLKLASLYSTATQELGSGVFKKPNSRFVALANLAKKNTGFVTFHRRKMEQREAKLEGQRKSLVSAIAAILSRVRQQITSDPFSPNSATFSQVLNQFKDTPKNLSLADLQKRVGDLRDKVRPLGVDVEGGVVIETPVVQSSTNPDKPIKNLSDLGNDDVIVLVNLGSGAKHAFRDLQGVPSFDKRIVLLCAPALQSAVKKYRIYLQSRLNEVFQDHTLKISNRCPQGFNDVDALLASGADFARGDSLPASVDIRNRFARNNLERILTVKKTEFDRELLKREILTSQYKSDIEGGVRKGFGALSIDNGSQMACLIDADATVHEFSLSKAKSAHEFASGVPLRDSVNLSTLEAFKQAQRGKCGMIYATATNLKTLLGAAKNANLSVSVVPVWTAPEVIAQRIDDLKNLQQNQDQAERERAANIKRKEIEAQKAAETKAAQLSQRQKQYRATYGAKVASLVASINANVLSGKSYWSELNLWRLDQTQKGWKIDSTVPKARDYGFAKWRGRSIETVFADVTFSMKHPDLGEYKQVCWTVGYINDTEFSRLRDLVAIPCSKKVKIAKWKSRRGFDTRWQLFP